MAVRRKSMMELVDADENYDTPPLEMNDGTADAAVAGPTAEQVAALDRAVEAMDALAEGRLADAIEISSGKPGTQLEMAIADPKPLDWTQGSVLFAKHSRLTIEESRLKAELKFIKAEKEIADLDLADWGRRLRQQHPVSAELDPVFGIPEPAKDVEPEADPTQEQPLVEDVPVDAASDEAPLDVDPETGEVLG